MLGWVKAKFTYASKQLTLVKKIIPGTICFVGVLSDGTDVARLLFGEYWSENIVL